MSIRNVYPPEVKTGGNLSIFGLKFEESDTIWLGNERIKSSGQPNDLIWSDGRIDLKVPEEIRFRCQGRKKRIVGQILRQD
jgi:hypothetical protein